MLRADKLQIDIIKTISKYGEPIGFLHDEYENYHCVIMDEMATYFIPKDNWYLDTDNCFPAEYDLNKTEKTVIERVMRKFDSVDAFMLKDTEELKVSKVDGKKRKERIYKDKSGLHTSEIHVNDKYLKYLNVKGKRNKTDAWGIDKVNPVLYGQFNGILEPEAIILPIVY